MFIERGFDPACDSDAGDGDQVVPTCMAHTGKCVHLRVDPDRSSTGSVTVCSQPSGLEMIVGSDGKALLDHECRQDIVGIANA